MIAYGHDVQNKKLNLHETNTLFARTLKGLLDVDHGAKQVGQMDRGGVLCGGLCRES